MASTKSGDNDYSAEWDMSKGAVIINHLVTEATKNNIRDGHTYLIAVENYFNLPNVMKMLRDMKVWCFSTAGPKTG